MKNLLISISQDLLPKYGAKLCNFLQGGGSKEDEDLFQPIEEMAHELNHCRLLIISSPIWNFSFPYVLKQYIDIALQPGVNFHEEPEEQPVTGSKTLVVVSSSGGHYGVVRGKMCYVLSEYIQI